MFFFLFTNMWLCASSSSVVHQQSNHHLGNVFYICILYIFTCQIFLMSSYFHIIIFSTNFYIYSYIFMFHPQYEQVSTKFTLRLRNVVAAPGIKACTKNSFRWHPVWQANLIFDIFFTRTHFKSWKFYTRKVRKFTTKLPKTLFFWFFWIFYTQPKFLHARRSRRSWQISRMPTCINILSLIPIDWNQGCLPSLYPRWPRHNNGLNMESKQRQGSFQWEALGERKWHQTAQVVERCGWNCSLLAPSGALVFIMG